MSHGTNACYQKGCRLPECKTAHKVWQSKWLQTVARKGHRRVPVAPTANAIRYLRAAGITWQDIRSRAGMPGRSFDDLANGAYLNVTTRDRLHKAMHLCLQDLAERVADAEAAVAFADGRSGPVACFPTEPLRAAVNGHTGQLEPADRRYLYRGRPLTPERVQRICLAVGIEPEAVYPDWYQLEEAG